AVARNYQSLLRFDNTRFRDKLGGGFAKSFMEQTSEVTAGHGRSLCVGGFGKDVAEMREDPRGKISETVRRLDLKFQSLRTLFLFAGPLNVNKQFARYSQREMTTD